MSVPERVVRAPESPRGSRSAERIEALTKTRRDERTGKEGTGFFAAEELTRLRGNFGDWCWFAWYCHKRRALERARQAIQTALQLRPEHHEARAFSAQLDSEWEHWKAEQQAAEARRQRERVRDALIHQYLTQYDLDNPPKPPLTVPPHLRANSGENSLLDSIRSGRK